METNEKKSAVIYTHELTKQDILEQFLCSDEPADFWHNHLDDYFIDTDDEGEMARNVWAWLWRDGITDEAYDHIMALWPGIKPWALMEAYWSQGENYDFYEAIEGLPHEFSSYGTFWEAVLERLTPEMRSVKLTDLGIV